MKTLPLGQESSFEKTAFWGVTESAEQRINCGRQYDYSRYLFIFKGIHELTRPIVGFGYGARFGACPEHSLGNVEIGRWNVVYPLAEVQLCIVHQILLTLRYVPKKDKKAAITDLKLVYQTNNQDQGYENLLEFEEKWSDKYPLTVKGRDNWGHPSTYFEYSKVIRSAFYTTFFNR